MKKQSEEKPKGQQVQVPKVSSGNKQFDKFMAVALNGKKK